MRLTIASPTILLIAHEAEAGETSNVFKEFYIMLKAASIGGSIVVILAFVIVLLKAAGRLCRVYFCCY